MSDNRMINDNAEEEVIKLQDLWAIFVAKWYWFLISVCACMAVAVIYLAVTPSVYTRSTSVLIKDNNKGSSGLSTEDAFMDMGMFKSNTNIKNEMLTIKTPELMEEVVRRLGLDVTYTTPNRAQVKVLYKTSPITVDFAQTDAYPDVSLIVNLLPKHKVSISDLYIKDEEVACDEAPHNFGDTITTPIGKICVNPTGFYADSYAGSPITVTKRDVPSAALSYFTVLQVALAEKESTVVNISIDDVSPARAEDILNTLVTVYNENWVRNKNRITVSTSEFINDRLVGIERELGGVDDDISSFKSKNLLPDIMLASGKYFDQSSENEQTILSLNTQNSMARYIATYLREDKELKKLLPANSGVDNAKLETQIGQYNELMLKRNNLLANSSEKNPLVIDMNKSLAAMKEAIIHSIDDFIALINIQIKNITKSESANKNKLASSPTQQKYLLSVERQQKVKESLYLFLLQKREENELSQAFSAYNTTVINSPRGPVKPIAPRKSIILLIAYLLGILLPAVILFLRESMNTLVRSRLDLASLTMPFAGEIPLLGDKKSRFSLRRQAVVPMGIVIENRNRDMINEAFRILRTNIDFMRGKPQQGSIMMATSMNPGSGKTFVLSNLAVSMAIKGAKTIVIDTDLRKATLSKLLDVYDGKKGLSDYLNGDVADMNKIIIEDSKVKNLSIISTGTIPPNPSELLLSSNFEKLLAELRTRYDYIFLDCPPVEMVTDAAIIGKFCDMTLFIVRAGLFDRRMLPELESLYAENKYHNMCLILNATEQNSSRYGYRKYGYYHYGHKRHQYYGDEK